MSDIQLNSGFFNAVMVDGEPDRVYDAEQVNDYFKGLISEDGIFANVSTACQVLAGTGMQVIVKAGRGKVGNNWFEVDRDLTIDLTASDVVLNRIDGIFIQRDSSSRTVSLVVKSSDLASVPTSPEVTRDETIHEICLAKIQVNKNVSTITQAMITDTRSNNDLCGWITGLIEQMDTTTLFNQYQTAQATFLTQKTTEFEDWFNNVKETVTAVNLYREYKAVYATATTNVSQITIPTTINYEPNGLDVLNVYVNGWRLNQNEYQISNGKVVFTNPLTMVNTIVEFVNKKCVEGTVAESTVLRLEALEQKVNSNYNCCYEATGSDDNISLSNMIRNFLNATEDYGGISDNASMFVKVSGLLGITSLIDGNVFDFNSATTSKRRVIVDFSGATIPLVNFSDSTIAVFGCTDHTKIVHANVSVLKNASQSVYVMYGGLYDDCHVYIDCNSTAGTCYGAYDCGNVSNSVIEITNVSSTAYGIFSCKKSLFNEITMDGGTSIRAVNQEMMVGNIVNQPINKASTCVEIGTVTI